MNKTLIAGSSFVIALFFSADASLTAADWYSFLYGDNAVPQSQPTHFNESTDLINGQILLSSGLVKTHRFFGPAKYDRFYEKGNPASVNDTSKDPMTQLLIYLFPSAGISLNASGKGSISEVFRETSETEKANTYGVEQSRGHITFIAIMYAVADFVREMATEGEPKPKYNEANVSAKMLKLKRILDLSDDIPVKKQTEEERLRAMLKTTPATRIAENEGILNRTIDALIKAVKSECKEDAEPRYPREYANYLLSAYAWSVLNTKEDIQSLDANLPAARALVRKAFVGNSAEGYTPNPDVLDSPVTKAIYTYEKSYKLYMPLRPSDSIITNGIASYEGTTFADCTDTALRQFCTVVLCKRDDATGKIFIDKDRIKGLPRLEAFFNNPGLKPSDYANSGESSIRSAWAEVVGRLPGVLYMKQCCELHPGWVNIIKAFCRLMDGYKATEKSGERGRRAQATIEKVNRGDTFQDILKVLNDIIGVRDDVALFAENAGSGNFKIYPSLSDERDKKNNTIIIRDTGGHTQVYMNEGEKSERISATTNSSWVKLLYNGLLYEDQYRGGALLEPAPECDSVFTDYDLLRLFWLLPKRQVNNIEALADSGIFGPTNDGIFRSAGEIYSEFVENGNFLYREVLDRLYQPKRIREEKDAKDNKTKEAAIGEVVDKLKELKKDKSGEYKNDALMVLCSTQKELVAEAAIGAIEALRKTVSESVAATTASAVTEASNREKINSRQKEIANTALKVLHINYTPISVGNLLHLVNIIDLNKENIMRAADLIHVTDRRDFVIALNIFLSDKIPLFNELPFVFANEASTLLEKLEKIEQGHNLKINIVEAAGLLKRLLPIWRRPWDDHIGVMILRNTDINLSEEKDVEALIKSVGGKTSIIYRAIARALFFREEPVSVPYVKYLLQKIDVYSFGDVLKVCVGQLTEMMIKDLIVAVGEERAAKLCEAMVYELAFRTQKISPDLAIHLLDPSLCVFFCPDSQMYHHSKRFVENLSKTHMPSRLLEIVNFDNTAISNCLKALLESGGYGKAYDLFRLYPLKAAFLKYCETHPFL
ncbi:hypothetical protein FACS189449_02620 [Alphaproteobacteria bacterium]|nr:hypothetical protein FACS189449_02620 [Alphaproteobacteria bacterium]